MSANLPSVNPRAWGCGMTDELIAQYTNDIAEGIGDRIPKATLRELVTYWAVKHSVKCSEFANFRTAVLVRLMEQKIQFAAFLNEEEAKARQ